MSKRPDPVDVMTKVARRWSATVHQSTWEFDPWLEFKVEGVSAALQVHVETMNAPAWSRIQLRWPSTAHLRVAPQDLSTWIRRAFGASDLQVGDPGFDSAFWIETSDETWARGLLDADLRRRLMELRDLGRGRNRLCLDVTWVGISAWVFRRLSSDEEALVALVEIGLGVLHRVRGPRKAEPVAFESFQATHAGHCPVCGSQAKKSHDCPGCGTPHHAECWKYAGGCGMFACSGRSRRRSR